MSLVAENAPTPIHVTNSLQFATVTLSTLQVASQCNLHFVRAQDCRSQNTRQIRLKPQGNGCLDIPATQQQPMDFCVFVFGIPNVSFRGRLPARVARTQHGLVDVHPRNLGCLQVERRPAVVCPFNRRLPRFVNRMAKCAEPSGGHPTLFERSTRCREGNKPRDDSLYHRHEYEYSDECQT